LAQAFISLGVKYGQVSTKDVVPHPTTVSRRILDVAVNIRHDVVIPDIRNCLNKWGGGITTDTWDRVVSASELHHCDGLLRHRRNSEAVEIVITTHQNALKPPF